MPKYLRIFAGALIGTIIGFQIVYGSENNILKTEIETLDDNINITEQYIENLRNLELKKKFLYKAYQENNYSKDEYFRNFKKLNIIEKNLYNSFLEIDQFKNQNNIIKNLQIFFKLIVFGVCGIFLLLIIWPL